MAAQESDATFGPNHIDSALVRLNQALVMSTSDDLIEASRKAEASFRTIIRQWPRHHPLVLASRLLIATVSSEAGRPSDALDHLFILLEDAGLETKIRPQSQSGERPFDVPALRAVSWTAIGNLLLDAATHVTVALDSDRDLVGTGHLRAPTCLEAAEACFAIARRLFDAHPERRVVECLDGKQLNDDLDSLYADLGLLEVQLRRGRASTEFGCELVARARRLDEADRARAAAIDEGAWSLIAPGDYTEQQSRSISITTLRALAKFVRATRGSGDAEWVDQADNVLNIDSADFWRDLVIGSGSGEDMPAYNFRDRIEFALAWEKLLLDGGAETSDEQLKDLGSWLEDDLLSLRAVVDEARHHQVALRYSALAQLPGKSGKQHREARNLREVERSRVLLADRVLDQLESRLEAERQLMREGSDMGSVTSGPKHLGNGAASGGS